ncbi:MAG TPA: DUF488 domain-containing protein [Kofleriaceae bacterium]|nr:DUF488 domain-containing protein [Kofleriaceae bacterium]
MTAIYTIGHSGHPAPYLVDLLRGQSIETLVDVRSRPYSKWAPQFRKEVLAQTLRAERIDYVFLGRELGGRPEGAEYLGPDGKLDPARRALALDFLAGIDQLITLAAAAPTAILCAEEDPDGCHRRRLIAPVLRQRDIAVLHIRGDGRLEPDQPPATAQLRLFE